MSFDKVPNDTNTHKTMDNRTSSILSDRPQGHYLSFLCSVCS